jgi:dTDP-glucose 4,6-dehydratase
MKLLLTGGTGFFGKSLLRHWLAQQQAGIAVPEICVLSRNPENFLAANPEFGTLGWLHFAKGDVLEADSLPRGERFSHVLHAATESTLGPGLPLLQQYDQIVFGARHMLDFAVNAGARRFLFISSGAVYGSPPAQLDRIPENWLGMPDPLNPDLAYGVAKRSAEHLCALYYSTYGMETVVARCFAFVGPDLPHDVHFAIGNFIRDALTAEVITVRGNGSPLRSYMDQRDLASWLDALLLNGRSGQAYNVGSDRAISIADLAYLVRDTLAPNKPVRILSAPDENQHRNIYVPDISKGSAELGLRVNIALSEAITHAAKRD